MQLLAPVLDETSVPFSSNELLAALSQEKQSGGLVDRAGTSWLVFDVDGTREAARQRALPQSEDLPAAFRQLDEICAPGYRGRKRGQVVRTRTVISQAHSSQWLGRKSLEGVCAGKKLPTHSL